MDRDSYDDMGNYGHVPNNRPHDHRKGGSHAWIAAVIIVGILVCAGAIFLWIKLFPTTTESAQPAVAAAMAIPAEIPISLPPIAIDQPQATQPETVAAVPVATSPVAVAPSTETTARSLDAPKQDVALNSNAVQYIDHVIVEGEDLAAIAASYGLRPETLISVNKVRNLDAIAPGTVLRIPDRDGKLYVVQEGDFLSTISRKFSSNLGWKTLQELNGLASENLKVGQVLFIPDMNTTAASSMQVAAADFSKPATGRVIALYDQTVVDPIDGTQKTLDGILIRGTVGAPVYASSAGDVVDAGYEPQGRGRFVQIGHEGGYKTSYQHLENVGVKVGDKVRQGEAIGSMGTTGTGYTEPTLFFKIEQKGIALDPMNFFNN